MLDKILSAIAESVEKDPLVRYFNFDYKMTRNQTEQPESTYQSYLDSLFDVIAELRKLGFVVILTPIHILNIYW